MAGIICIETDFEITCPKRKLHTNSEHLIKFLSEEFCIPHIYRRVATYQEFDYYTGQFAKKLYDKYDFIYLSFHGDTHSIFFEGDKKDMPLRDLAVCCKDRFINKYVHFGSCRTMLGSRGEVDFFKEQTGAKVVSGYTKSVNSSLCAIHDMALIREFVTRKQIAPMFKCLKDLYGGLGDKLGFKNF